MAWVTLNPQHVKARMAGDEHAALIEANEHAQDFDQMQAVLDQVTALVRGKVCACGDHLGGIGEEGTIPVECVFAAATIARDALVNSLPLAQSATETRRDEVRRAHEFLDAVARGEVAIEADDGTVPGTDAVEYGGKDLLDFAQ